MTDPRIERSRLTVLAVTIDLLATTQPSNITVEEIAAKSHVSKATIYRHWPSRDHILVDAINSLTSELPTPQTDLPFEEAIQAFVTELVDIINDPNRAGAHQALLILSRHNPTFAELHQRAHHTLSAAVDALVRRGITEGHLDPDTDSNIVAAQLVGPFLFAFFESTPAVHALTESVSAGVLRSHRPRPTTARRHGTSGQPR